MALKPCKECGTQISTDAKSCPHCGKKKTSRVTIMVGVMFALFIIMAIISNMRSEQNVTDKSTAENARRVALTPAQRVKEDAEAAKENRLSTATALCYNVLKKSLDDPDSAKLDFMSEWYSEERKDGTIRVQPTGRAKNAFGAYINGTWDCVVKEQNNTLLVTKFKQIRP